MDGGWKTVGSGIQGGKGKDLFALPLGPLNPWTLFLFVFKDAAGFPIDDRYIRGPDPAVGPPARNWILIRIDRFSYPRI